MIRPPKLWKCDIGQLEVVGKYLKLLDNFYDENTTELIKFKNLVVA